MPHLLLSMVWHENSCFGLQKWMNRDKYSEKGKPAERQGRKGTGSRQTDLGKGVGFGDGRADPHKIAALLKMVVVRFFLD
jgi:hypothetical protein